MNKKLFFTISIFITIVMSSSGQIQKGAILTGGSLSFFGSDNTREFNITGSTSVEESELRFLAIKPKVGFFLNETLLLGIGLAYEHSSTEFDVVITGLPSTEINEKNNTFFLNPYLTKYGKVTDHLYITTTLNLLFGVGTGVGKYGTNNDVETNIVEYRINVTPGLTYFISDKWALKSNIGQLYYNGKTEELSSTTGSDTKPRNAFNDYGVSFDFNTFSIGVQYLLNNEGE